MYLVVVSAPVVVSYTLVASLYLADFEENMLLDVHRSRERFPAEVRDLPFARYASSGARDPGVLEARTAADPLGGELQSTPLTKPGSPLLRVHPRNTCPVSRP